jgi:hypothetical protein
MKNDTTNDTTNAAQNNAGGNYWEGRMADDLAAIESADSLAVPLREAARGLIALASNESREIDDALMDSPVGAFEAHHAALRLCRAALDSIEFSISEAIVREAAHHRRTLQNIESTGILAECEAVVLAAQREE